MCSLLPKGSIYSSQRQRPTAQTQNKLMIRNIRNYNKVFFFKLFFKKQTWAFSPI